MILIQYAHETLLNIFHIAWMFHPTEAPKRIANDTILLLENKIWRAKFLSEKSYTQKIEFRDCVLYEIFTQKERRLQ